MKSMFKLSFKAIVVLLACFFISLILIIPRVASNGSDDKVYENTLSEEKEYVEKEEAEEKVITNKDEIRKTLSPYEDMYKVCMDTIENEPMDDYLAEEIRRAIKPKLGEIHLTNIEKEYTRTLSNSLTAIMMGMEKYKEGNLNDAVRYVERAESLYDEYVSLFE